MAGRTPRVLVLTLVCLGLVLWHADWLVPHSPPPPSDPLPPLQRPLLSSAPLPPPSPPLTPTLLKEFTPSTHDLPLQGYNVFSHLYLCKGKLVYAPRNGKTARKVDRADVVSGEVGLADGRFEQVEDGKVWYAGLEGKEEGVEVIKGQTVFLNDEPGPGGFMVYHTHFHSEVLIPALKALSLASASRSEEPELARNLWIPRAWDEMGDKGWKDPSGENKQLAELLLGDTLEIQSFIDFDELATSGRTVVFERVVVVDRWAAHRHPATHKWNKMNSALADYPALQRKGATTAADDIDDGDWFKPYREMAHRSLGIAAEVGKEEGEGKGVVVYLDRNRAEETSRLSQSNHASLVSTLRPLSSLAEIHLTVLPNLLLHERISLLSRTKVLMGVHNERDFREVIWMKAGGVVLEFFGGSLIRDNALVSVIQGLEHLAVQPKRLIDLPTWLTLDQTRAEDWDSTELEVDVKMVERKIRDVLGL